MPVSGTPELSEVIAEFNGPSNLRAYNRGGTYVPNTPTNSAISTSSATLRLSQFAGASAAGVVNLDGHSISHSNFGGTAIAGFRFSSSGIVSQIQGVVVTQIDSGTDWVIPNAVAPLDYQIMASLQIGSTVVPSGPALDTWHDLTSNRQWTVSTSAGGTLSTTIVVEIRRSGGSVLDSGIYSMEAAS